LHALVFAINLDSVLNDIGMLLACGVLKKITCESVQSIFSTALLERKGHAKIRSADFYRTTFVGILSLMIPAVICLPLLVTGQTSFGEAEVRAVPLCQ
jgi:hypothetical protein